MISCCTDAPRLQLYGRTPHPLTYDGSYVRSKTALPRFVLFIAAHSPFFAVLDRSQLTTKSLFESVHVRVVLMAVRMMGLRSKSLLDAVTPCVYLPRLNLTAVLPLPN